MPEPSVWWLRALKNQDFPQACSCQFPLKHAVSVRWLGNQRPFRQSTLSDLPGATWAQTCPWPASPWTKGMLSARTGRSGMLMGLHTGSTVTPGVVHVNGNSAGGSAPALELWLLLPALALPCHMPAPLGIWVCTPHDWDF